jgi:hypothetical protein
MRERLYRVQAQLENRYAALCEGEAGTDTALVGRGDAANDTLYGGTLRLLNFDSIYDGYIAENPTQERFLDILTKMEREVFRIETPLAKDMRVAQVKIGEILNLKDYFEDYQHHKDATVQQLTQRIQHSFQPNVLALSRDQHPSLFPL